MTDERAISEATDLTLQVGETAIVRSAANERGFRIVARLTPDDWAWLADR